MCIFNTPVSEVRETRIFVGPTITGRQVTIYENYVGVAGGRAFAQKSIDQTAALKAKHEAELKDSNKNAMILPCPLQPNAPVQLLDLSKDGFSFAALNDCFPVWTAPAKRSRTASRSKSASQKLEVHQIGAYNMSIAPTLQDLQRIDPAVFKVAPNVEQLLAKHYSRGFGFIICAFDPTKEIKPHPIGYVHDKLDSRELFVPTRHEHGHDHPLDHPLAQEEFDHHIFSLATTARGEAGQTPEELTAALQEQHKERGVISPPKLAVLAALEKSAVLAPLLPKSGQLRRSVMHGLHENKDLVFDLA